MRERKNVRFNVNMYSDTKFKIIDTKPERDLIHYVWIRMVILAGKCNKEGELYMSRTIPYTVETLAIEFGRGYDEVKEALDLLMELEMIELTEENVFKVKNFVKHQNIKVKENTKTEDRNNIKEVVLKSNEIQEVKEKEVSKNQSSIAIVKNEAILKDAEVNIKEEKILKKVDLNEAEGGGNLQEKPSKLIKMKNNSKSNKKKKTEEIKVFDFEENKEEINGFHDGEIPLGKGERVIWEFAKLCEG